MQITLHVYMFAPEKVTKVGFLDEEKYTGKAKVSSTTWPTPSPKGLTLIVLGNTRPIQNYILWLIIQISDMVGQKLLEGARVIAQQERYLPCM